MVHLATGTKLFRIMDTPHVSSSPILRASRCTCLINVFTGMSRVCFLDRSLVSASNLLAFDGENSVMNAAFKSSYCCLVASGRS